MKGKIKFKTTASCEADCYVGNHSGFNFKGKWDVEHIRDGEVIYRETGTDNLTTDAGRNLALNAMFGGTAVSGTWYVGLKGSGAAAEADTMSSHAGWSEITAYTGSRKEYSESVSSGASPSVTNSASPAAFSMNGSATVAGAFVCEHDAGTGGTLFAVVDFSSSRTVASGDTLNVTYTISCSDS